jgi:hypothetical protein
VTSALRPVWDDHVGPYGWDGEIVGYDLGGVSLPFDAIAEARALVLAALAPAPLGTIQAELARMKISTKSRADGEAEGRLAAAVFAEYLSAYPADVVIWACRKWARTEKWWPSWAELKDLLDRGVRRRAALAKILGGT